MKPNLQVGTKTDFASRQNKVDHLRNRTKRNATAVASSCNSCGHWCARPKIRLLAKGSTKPNPERREAFNVWSYYAGPYQVVLGYANSGEAKKAWTVHILHFTRQPRRVKSSMWLLLMEQVDFHPWQNCHLVA